MNGEKKAIPKKRKGYILYAAVFILVNLAALALLGVGEASEINSRLSNHAEGARQEFKAIFENYTRSFRVFSQMMSREIERTPDPEAVLAYLKGMNDPLAEIEGDTFDGLYMSYKGKYLYSWDTPYSAYADYVITQRPWYTAAMEGQGKIVFTPPYMSYANRYILTTISQLQPDGETVFAYDIKMGDIQNLVSTLNSFDREEIMIFDDNGTIVGSTVEDYLGGDLDAEDTALTVETAREEMEAFTDKDSAEFLKAQDKLNAATAFYDFRLLFDKEADKLKNAGGKAVLMQIGGESYCSYLLGGEGFHFLITVPLSSMLGATASVWLVPLLLLEIALIYILGRISKGARNRELKQAYIELGQIQKRLEIALSAAQKAAAIDELTGLMNFRSFRKEMTDLLSSMDQEERGILIMIDGDHFKQVNDNYGHNVGDEVIKLSAQMIIGRIRTVDLASRLHGDEFAIFISNTADYKVAERIMGDINRTIAAESQKRNIPSITLSAGAIIAKAGDSYVALSKKADDALYKAKETHNGGFAHDH